ncbi:MAG: hypothetical protein Q4G49_16465 [Paracoccus sp. (in: a-proteobacteria)]|nr:hypothetical protein [Paracoccus sp. (in: a-proteobacteria)]
MKRRAKRVRLTLSAALRAMIGWLGFLLATGNTHPVITAELYRSAQPDAAMLMRMHRDHGIAGIINLRGENAGSPWYDEEIATAADLNIAHYDLGMSAARELTADEA